MLRPQHAHAPEGLREHGEGARLVPIAILLDVLIGGRRARALQHQRASRLPLRHERLRGGGLAAALRPIQPQPRGPLRTAQAAERARLFERLRGQQRGPAGALHERVQRLTLNLRAAVTLHLTRLVALDATSGRAPERERAHQERAERLPHQQQRRGQQQPRDEREPALRAKPTTCARVRHERRRGHPHKQRRDAQRPTPAHLVDHRRARQIQRATRADRPRHRVTDLLRASQQRRDAA